MARRRFPAVPAHLAVFKTSAFAALMEAVKTHSLGQISHALYEVGGEYRRNM